MTPMPAFRLHRPATVAEAVSLLGAAEGTRPLAGGTDLLVNLRHGLDRPPALVDLTAADGLDHVTAAADGLTLGATVRLSRLAEDPVVRAGWPVLARAAAVVAGPTHRVAATLAGNLCQDTRCVFVNQSDWWRAANGYCMKVRGSVCHVVKKSSRCYAAYAGDMAPALLVLGAEVAVMDAGGAHRLPLAALFRDDGRGHLTLEPGALVTAVHVPPADGVAADYVKVRIRESIDFPLVGVALALRRDGERVHGLRAALTGVASAPLSVPGLETLEGAPWSPAVTETLAAAVGKACTPLRTTAVSPSYRRGVAAKVAVRLAAALWAGTGAGHPGEGAVA